MQDLPTFDIRNFTERLVPNAKEKNKYICPNCNGHNLAIDAKSGAYQCFNGCSNQEVREAIRPWSEVKEERKENVFKSAAKPKIMTTIANNKPKEIKQEDYALIGQIYGASMPPVQNYGMERIIDFHYTSTQMVRRTEAKTATGWKKKDKIGCLPWHIDSNGQWENSKGELPWMPYHFEDIKNGANGRWILFVEGEKCVEYARNYFNLIATTFQGGSWGADTMQQEIKRIQDCGIAGIVQWPDHDQPGYTKAKKIKEICNELNLPYIQLDPLKIWENMPDKGDICDFYKKFKETAKKLVWDIILHSILEYNEEKLDPIARALIEEVAKEQPRLNALMRLYQENQDPVYQNLLKQQFLGFGYNPNILDAIISGSSATPKNPPSVMTLEDFNNYQFATSGWIYPELLIDCGVQIVSGLPGAMKTTFSYDMGFHYINNMPFLGEELSADARVKDKRLLIINSDQQSQEMQSFTKNAPLSVKAQKTGRVHVIGGNPNEEKWNLRYLPWLEEQIKRFKYTMTIIDSYNSIHSHVPDWNENLSTAAQGINALRALAEKYGIAIVVIHHDGKREDGSATIKTRGNTAIPGAASAVMSLTETKEDKNGSRDPLIRFLEISKLRGGACGKMVLKFDPQERHFDVLPDGNPQNRGTINHLATTLYNTRFGGTNWQNEYSFEELKKQFHAGGVGGDRNLFLSRVMLKLEQRGMVQRFMKGEHIYYKARPLPSVPVENVI